MCFSAGASFTTAVILVPAGLYCLQKASRINASNWVFALLPLVFGLQQGLEGGVWWGLDNHQTEVSQLSALGFLFFSHLFWPIWVPLSSYLTETIDSRKRLFLLMTIAGILFGASMYLPFLFNADWLSVSIVNHSIVYESTLIYDDYLPRLAVTAVYMLFVIMPLLLSSDYYHRNLGALVLLSTIITVAFFDFAFISVWCYFAAVISLYIYYITVIITKPVTCEN